MTKLYEFDQNNSGGKYIIDKDEGLAHSVFIEATSKEHAVLIAEKYLDNSSSCPCCGDRWCFYEPIEYSDEDAILKMVRKIFSNQTYCIWFLNGTKKFGDPKEMRS